MSTPDFSAVVARHRTYFRSGATRSAEWREGQLIALGDMMTERAEDFYAALWTDLRRNRTDADLTDVKSLATEADHGRGLLGGLLVSVRVSVLFSGTAASLGIQVQSD
jgi:acyl-CoA reductase-like NAD-dependent aldehyde dehydrogenase